MSVAWVEGGGGVVEVTQEFCPSLSSFVVFSIIKVSNLGLW